MHRCVRVARGRLLPRRAPSVAPWSTPIHRTILAECVASGTPNAASQGDHAMNKPLVSSEKIWFAHLLRGLAALLVVYRHLFEVFWLANPVAAALAHTEPLSSIPTLPHLRMTIALERLGLSAGS